MVMGRPNPAKLANFPECDVFVLIACAQTILLDSKEYLAPLITPFEAELAFVEGREWTGAFNLEICQVPQPTKESLDTSTESGAGLLQSLILIPQCLYMHVQL
jgi:diphthamide biosynthesis protein 2